MSAARVLLLCMASIMGLCEGLSVMRNLSPPRETSTTTLRLTAQRNDTGSWTTKFGDYHMAIEHKHFNSPEENDNADGTWTLKIKHTTTVFEDKPDDDDVVELKQNFPILQNEPEGGGILVLEETPQEESVPMIYEEDQEDRVLQPMALVYEENEDGEQDLKNILQSENNREEERVSAPDENTVLNILEHYRQQNSVAEEMSTSEHEVPTITMATTTEELPPPSVQVNEQQSNLERRGKMTSEEREHFHVNEERRQIMERYPRSRALDPISLGYSFIPEVGWLKLNTAHWQWDMARKSCQADGGHLAVPDTLPKIRKFVRLLKENTDVIDRAVLKNQVFVGVYDPNNNRKFTTVKGEPFIPESVSIWFPNEPNDADPGEDCVTLHLEGKLRDVPCFFNLPFICQIDLSDATVTS